MLDIAHSTWNYFNDYMIEEYNYLPPDNYQNKRKNLIAERTSSTNIGLGLLSIVSAKDLGFIDESEMIKRINKCVDVISSLDKWNGHLYNWYNIKTKEVLHPAFVSTVDSGNFVGYLYVVVQALQECEKSNTTDSIIEKINSIINKTNFNVLYDSSKSLFSVGFDIKENKLVESYYDLLASEARLASFIAIAKRDVPYKHWFSLGRSLTSLDGRKGLVSWGGTMFEYFMPYIIMKNYSYTLMDETYEFCIYSQIKYANKLNVPWGISESAFYLQDLNYNYQYKTFGIPWLGVKRGLKEEVVVSPYSSIMAIEKAEKDVMKNIWKLKKIGAYGKYGFFDAVDYTPNRVGRKEKAVVKTYMAHHQALILISINNYINANILKERFFKNPEIKTLEILLQERVPQNIIFTKKKKEKVEALKYVDYEEYSKETINIPTKNINVLSNDNYTLIISDEGEGYSWCNGDMITRYNDNQKISNFVCIKDIKEKHVWTNFKMPSNITTNDYRVEFSPDSSKFYRNDFNVSTVTKIVISPEDNVEIRCVTLTNNRKKEIELEVISYLESPLCKMDEDNAHMAFSNLFLEVKKYDDVCILKRRNRNGKQGNKYLINFAIQEDIESKFDVQIDKGAVVGIGNDLSKAEIIFKDKMYNNEIYPNINTVISYKTKVSIKPSESKTISYIYGYGKTEEECLEIFKKYKNQEIIKMTFELALSRSIVENRFLGYRFKEIIKYNNIIRDIIYGSETRKKYEDIILNNNLNKRDLWKFGISGDLPIVLVKVKNINETDIIAQLVELIKYANYKKIMIDLVILNEETNSYEEYVKERIFEIINFKNANQFLNINGGIHIVKKVQITNDETNLLFACSDVIFDASLGLIEGQISEG